MASQHHDSPSPTTVSTSSTGSADSSTEYEGFDPDLPDEGEKKKFLGLSTVQIGASALAAVTSAVVASFFGVAGTLIGAAVGSIISTVGGAMYAESLRRASGRLREVQTVAIQLIPRGTDTQPQQVPSTQALASPAAEQADNTIVLPVGEADATTVMPAAEDDPAGRGGSTGPTSDPAAATVVGGTPAAAPATEPPGKRPWWRRPLITLPLVGISGFVIAIALITGVEGLTGKTLSGGSGTSLSKIGEKKSSSAPTSTATVTVTTTATPESSATETTQAPETTDPAAGTDPSAEPTATSTGDTAATPTATSDPDSTSGTGAQSGDTSDGTDVQGEVQDNAGGDAQSTAGN